VALNEASYQGDDQKKFHFLFLICSKQASVVGNALTLKELDPKVLFMTARPGRCRAFLPTDRFLKIWEERLEIFTQSPPEVATIYAGMEEDRDGKAEALPIQISHPKKKGDGWEFSSSGMPSRNYADVIFFIDWPASLICPEPIRLLVPSLFDEVK
jgi:hypothetical protein